MLEGLLRANLHQRQYADLVARVLSRLASSGGVSNGELSLLWNIAQKVSWRPCLPVLVRLPISPAQQPMCAMRFVPDVSVLACHSGGSVALLLVVLPAAIRACHQGKRKGVSC